MENIANCIRSESIYKLYNTYLVISCRIYDKVIYIYVRVDIRFKSFVIKKVNYNLHILMTKVLTSKINVFEYVNIPSYYEFMDC